MGAPAEPFLSKIDDADPQSAKILFLAVGCTLTRAIIAKFPADSAYAPPGVENVFLRLLKTSQNRFAPDQRIRLEWGEYCVNCLVSTQGHFLHVVVTPLEDYPPRVAFALLREIDSEVLACTSGVVDGRGAGPGPLLGTPSGAELMSAPFPPAEWRDLGRSPAAFREKSQDRQDGGYGYGEAPPGEDRKDSDENYYGLEAAVWRSPQIPLTQSTPRISRGGAAADRASDDCGSQAYEDAAMSGDDGRGWTSAQTAHSAFSRHSPLRARIVGLLTKYNNPEECDEVYGALNRSSDVHSALKDSLHRAISFSANIEALEEKSASLSHESFDFDQRAVHLRKSNEFLPRLWGILQEKLLSVKAISLLMTVLITYVFWNNRPPSLIGSFLFWKPSTPGPPPVLPDGGSRLNIEAPVPSRIWKNRFLAGGRRALSGGSAVPSQPKCETFCSCQTASKDPQIDGGGPPRRCRCTDSCQGETT